MLLDSEDLNARDIMKLVAVALEKPPLPRRMLERSKAFFPPNSCFALFPCICFVHFRSDVVRHNSAQTLLLHSKVRTTCRDLSEVVLLAATGCGQPLRNADVKATCNYIIENVGCSLRRSVLTGFQSFGDRSYCPQFCWQINLDDLRFHAIQPRSVFKCGCQVASR